MAPSHTPNSLSSHSTGKKPVQEGICTGFALHFPSDGSATRGSFEGLAGDTQGVYPVTNPLPQ